MSDFAWPIHVGSSVQRLPQLLRAQFNNGYTQIGARGDRNALRKFSWRIDNQPNATLNAIDDFLVAHVGQNFTWTPPEGGEISVFTPEDGWNYTYSGGTIIGISGMFEEV